MHHLSNSFVKVAFLSFALLMLGSGNLFSADRIEIKPETKEFSFVGQAQEILDLQSETIRHVSVSESYQTTCQREVPTQEQVCRNETQYKEECHWSQPRESCQSVPRQQCETRYEQQCSYQNEQVCNQVPRQSCQQIPQRVCQTVTRYRQECRNQPGPPVCHIENGRRVCRPSGGQQVCHQVPYHEQVCNVEYRQVCSTQYQTVCRNEPRHVCQNVPRQHCGVVYENQCTQIPGERICNQVPHTVPVCHMENRTRTESYACTQTRIVERAEPAQINRSRVIFSFSEEFEARREIRVFATLSGEELLLRAESGPAALIWAQKSYEQSRGDEQIIRVHLKIMKKNGLVPAFSQELSNLQVLGRELQFTSGKIVNAANISLRLRVVSEGQQVIDRVLLPSEFDVRILESGLEQSLVAVKLSELGLRLTPNKRHQVQITLTPSMAGEAINMPGVIWFKEISQSF